MPNDTHNMIQCGCGSFAKEGEKCMGCGNTPIRLQAPSGDPTHHTALPGVDYAGPKSNPVDGYDGQGNPVVRWYDN